MRVGLVCPYSVSLPGGVQGQVLGLASALARRGHDVMLVAPCDKASEPGTRRDLGDRVRFVPAGTSLRVPVNGSRAPVALGPRAATRALRALGAFRPDVLHVHEPFVPFVPLATLGAHALRATAVVATFHRSGAGLVYRVTRPVARAALRRIDEVVVVSAAARSTLEVVLGRSISGCGVEPNGVDVERFAQAVAWPSTRPTVVFAGRHERRKGLAVLLEAFSEIPGEVGLWIVGAGPETDALRERFRDDGRIEWCGQLSDEELARRVAGARICVAPSLGGESFGVVLLEAMAAGTAVVASDIDGYRAAADGAALLVAPGDARALAFSLSQLLADGPGRDVLVAAGRVRAEECSMERVAERYISRYLATIANVEARAARAAPDGAR